MVKMCGENHNFRAWLLLFFCVFLLLVVIPAPVEGVGIKLRVFHGDLKADPDFLEEWVQDIEGKNCWLFSYRHPKYNQDVWDMIDYHHFQKMPQMIGSFEPGPWSGAGPDLKTRIEKRPKIFRWATHAKHVLCFIGFMQYPANHVTNIGKFFDGVTSSFFYVSPVNKSSSLAWSKVGAGGGVLRPKETWLFRFESKPLSDIKDILGLTNLMNHLGLISYVRLTHKYFPIPPMTERPLYLQIHSVIFVCPICFPGQSGLQNGEKLNLIKEEMQINFYNRQHKNKLTAGQLLKEDITASQRLSYQREIKAATEKFKEMSNSRNFTTVSLTESRLDKFLTNPQAKDAKRSFDLIIDEDPVEYLAFRFFIQYVFADLPEDEMFEKVKFEEPEDAKSREKSLGWFNNTNRAVFQENEYDMEPLEGNRWYLGFSERFLSEDQYQIRAYPAGSQTYNFITSDGVHTKKTGLEIYYGPFQWPVWLLLFLLILLTSNVYPSVGQFINLDEKSFDKKDLNQPLNQSLTGKALFRYKFFSTWIWIFRMLMDQPVETPFTVNKSAIIPFGKIVFVVWILMALVLSNAYRGIIKAEYAISYPWTTDWDKAQQFIGRENDFFVYYTQANFQCETEKLVEYKGVFFTLSYTKSVFLAPFEEDFSREFYACQNSCGDLNRPLDLGHCKANEACKEYDRKVRIKSRRIIICPEEVPQIIRSVLYYPKHALIFREQDFDQMWKVFQLEMEHNVTTKFASRAQNLEGQDASFIKKKGFYVRFHLKPFDPDFLDRAVKVMFSSGIYWWWEKLEKFKYLIHQSRETSTPVITTGKGQNSGQGQGQGQPTHSEGQIKQENKKFEERSPKNSTTLAAGQKKGREREEKVKGLSFANSDIHLIFFVFAFLIGCTTLVFLHEVGKRAKSKFKLEFNLKAAKQNVLAVPGDIILVQPTKFEPMAKTIKNVEKGVATKKFQNVVVQVKRKKNM